jgi:AP-1 complex subunit mu
MVSAIYILHWPENDLPFQYGELLLHRRYHSGLPSDGFIINTFNVTYKAFKPEQRVPFINSKGINFIYVRGGDDILIVAVTIRNVDAMQTIVFLNHFYGTLCHYLCQEDGGMLSKDRITDNLHLIFDLIDECIDHGIVQVTDYNILKEYIKLEVNLPKIKFEENIYESDSDSDRPEAKTKSKKREKKIKSTHNRAITTDQISEDASVINSSILRTYSLAINWRPKGIFYAKNEIYIDLTEECEFYYDLETELIKVNEIKGTCFVKCYLSGMPLCKLGFNKRQISGIHEDADMETDHDNMPTDRPGNLIVEEFDDENDEEELESKNSEKENTTAKKIPISESLESVPSNKSFELSDSLLQSHNPGSKNSSQKTTKVASKPRIPIRNIQFHQCIELGALYKDNLVTFTPPDDKFVLMTYNVEQQKQKYKLPLIMIKPTYRIIKETRKLQVMCTLSTNFKRRLHCRDLIVRIPINPHIFNISYSKDDEIKYKAEMGDVNYKIDTSELCWTLDNITGKKSVRMMAELSLSESDGIEIETIQRTLNNKFHAQETREEIDDSMHELDRFYGVNGETSSLAQQMQLQSKLKFNYHDVNISFTIPMLSYSGLKLNYLRVDEEKLKYTCFPWIRYQTESKIKSNEKVCDYRFKLGLNCFEIIR